MYLNSMPVLLWKWKASNMATVMFVCKQWHKRYDLVFPTSTSKWFLNFNFHHDVEMSHVSSVSPEISRMYFVCTGSFPIFLVENPHMFHPRCARDGHKFDALPPNGTGWVVWYKQRVGWLRSKGNLGYTWEGTLAGVPHILPHIALYKHDKIHI